LKHNFILTNYVGVLAYSSIWKTI